MHTFYMPFGECTVTLQDVAYQFGFPVDGEAELFGQLPSHEHIEKFTASYSWFQETFRVLPHDANEETLGSTTLAWQYRSICRVVSRKVVQVARPLGLLHTWIFWRFPCLRPHGFDNILWPLASRWGGYLPSSDEKAPRVLQMKLKLDMLRETDFIWVLYSALEVVGVVDPAILEERHTRCGDR
ncbi:hypothetical protein PIB30_052366 [Stylosanthes scabra]|uniref:Aminotransferase-like plant mobile domain-containing protein n=1 Tax=Stylosanthes scabra TaxID=79078 RepID=A0ABU6TIK2_9FABA|nr:hypothetical protein [Stylosanthes scabra]